MTVTLRLTVTMFEVSVITGTTRETVAWSGGSVKTAGGLSVATITTDRFPPPLRGDWQGRVKKVTLGSRWWVSVVARVYTIICLCEVVVRLRRAGRNTDEGQHGLRQFFAGSESTVTVHNGTTVSTISGTFMGDVRVCSEITSFVGTYLWGEVGGEVRVCVEAGMQDVQ